MLIMLCVHSATVGHLFYMFLLEEQKKERNNASEKNRRKRNRMQSHFLFNNHKQSLLQKSDKIKEGRKTQNIKIEDNITQKTILPLNNKITK